MGNRNYIQDQSTLEKIVRQHPTFRRVPLHRITVHSQMRKTFEPLSLEALAENIHLISLLHPIVLNHDVKANTLNLVSGERRYRAFGILHGRYGKHFSQIPAFVFKNLTPLQHKAAQAGENSYVPVDPVEAAEFYGDTYEFMKKVYNRRRKKLTKVMFAKIVGRSPDAIADALKFVELSPDIKKWAKQKLLPYGAAVLLTRLPNPEQRRFYAEHFMRRSKAVRDPYKVDHFRKVINAVLADQGQVGLFGDAGDAVAQDQRLTLRRLVGKDVQDSFIASAVYLNTLIDLERQGNLTTRPLQSRSIRRNLRRLHEVTRALLEYSRYRRATDDPYEGPELKIHYKI